MIGQYLIQNCAMPTTAAFPGVATGASIKTMLQVKTVLGGRVVAWGYSFNGSSAATPGKVELLTTGAIAATVTAAVENDIVKWGGSGDLPNTSGTLLTFGTTSTGYTSSGEGSIVASRTLDPGYEAPTNKYVREFSLGYRPFIAAADYLRIRAHMSADVNMHCWVVLEF